MFMTTTAGDASLEVVPPAAAGLDARALGDLKNWIERDVAAGRAHGAAVLVARRGKVALFESIGSSDVTKDRVARPDDLYCTMSLGKSLTAAAVLALIDRGLLTFDSRIAEFLPEFGARGKDKVTIYHLLTHSGGVYSGWLAPGRSTLDGPEDIDLRPYVEKVCAQSLEFRPGGRVYYSPFAGYYILGAVIEKVTGKRFRDALKDLVLDPVGLVDTTCGLPTDEPRRVPIRMAERTAGVVNMDVQERLNTILDETVDSPAGLLFTSASDMYRFTEALRLRGRTPNGRLFSKAMGEYAYRVHTGDMPNEFWDFNKEMAGIAEFPANFALGGGYSRGVGHYLNPCGLTASPNSFSGLGSGSTHVLFDPERELTLVFLSGGLYVGLAHIQRCQILSDLALAAVID
jgi:CubicO group peptidase (beta-lactamase class C family)